MHLIHSLRQTCHRTGIMMYLSRMEFIKRSGETLPNHHLLRLGLLTCLTLKNPLNQSLLKETANDWNPI